MDRQFNVRQIITHAELGLNFVERAIDLRLGQPRGERK
jgi:hypothetical protein